MLSEEEKNSMELDIETKYVGRTEKEFLNNITYAECLYILDTKNKYCDDIRNLSLLKIVDIVNEQSKEIEELKQNIHLKEVYVLKTNDYIKGTNIEDELCNKKWEDKIKAKIEELENQKRQWIEDRDNKHKDSEIIYAIEVLQSLLEKE